MTRMKRWIDPNFPLEERLLAAETEIANRDTAPARCDVMRELVAGELVTEWQRREEERPLLDKDVSGRTYLEPNDVAVVLRDGDAVLVIPKQEEGDVVPTEQLAVTAMYIRWLRDPEWVADLGRWFRDQVEKMREERDSSSASEG